MIRMIPSRSAEQAKNYFSDALLKSDYYMEDQEANGNFQGKLADRLNISGPATKDVFFSLCENRHSKTGKRLTARDKADRTTGYDFNFHVPKSVSILHILSKDDHILNAFHSSVTDTMHDIEADSMGRVRKGGKYTDRETGELVWVDFIHQTARPVDGFAPDPHLHAHCYVFNATWDQVEGRIKAAQFRNTMRDMPYYQAMFHKRLSDRLIALGYQVERTEKSFEVKGVPKETIKLFSKRTNEIGQIAKEKGISDAKALSELGAKTRSKKQKGLTMAELKADWRQQIRALESGQEKKEDTIIRFAPQKEQKHLSPERCIDHALQQGFERASVLPYRRVLANAYRHSLGNTSVSVDSITEALKQDARVIRVKERGQTMCTTKEVLREEKRMVELAQAGRGKFLPMYTMPPEIGGGLKIQQANAVKHVLTTGDRVSIIRGAAGTGKTTLMSRAVKLMEGAGKKVTVVAPTAQASRGVLRDDGFDKAETVARLLVDQKMQDALQDQVLWVDEAGLLGTKDMVGLLQLASKKNARLILGGDTKQHSSVIRGDALRILNTVAGIRSAEVSEIYRQKDDRYKRAVEDLSKGNVRDGFEKLDLMDAIKEVNPLNITEDLVNDYVAALKNKKDALVISPTHKQGNEVTDAIRQKLKETGMIGKKEITIKKLVNLNMTIAEKEDWRNFQEGQKIQFNQNTQKVKRGSLWTVDKVSDSEVHIKNRLGYTTSLPKKAGSKYDIFQQEQIAVSKGDKIRITRNGFDNNNRRIDNGWLLEVASINKSGAIKLRKKEGKTTYTLDSDFGHLSHAHCVTSHFSQGKTVDEVFVAQPAATFSATDAKQFYVSVSRAKERVSIYTDDKALLLEYASELGDRQSALELTSKNKKHLDHVLHMERGNIPVSKDALTKDKQQPEIEKHFKREDYEPSF